MDVKTAFLYGKIDAEVYIELLSNLKSKYPVNKVCKLNKELYNLKQAPKIWYNILCKELRTLGFKNINKDYSIFMHEKKQLVINIYIDNLLIIEKNQEAIDKLKVELQT